MSRTRWAGTAFALLLAAPLARAQDAPAAQDARAGGAQGGSTSFEQACVDLLKGRPPAGGPDAADALRKACGDLMSSRARAQRDTAERAELQRAQGGEPRAVAEATGAQGAAAAEGTGGGAQGQGSAAAQGLGAAFAQAGRELTGPRRTMAMGLRGSGRPVGFSLMTNPIGWFTGLGINAEAFGPLRFLPKVSWVGGARYSRTDATNGSVDTFGLEGGADYFVFGRYNEGLRVGPRLEVAFGRESFQTSTSFGWLGLSGEVGYNFIATNGITGAVAAGLGGRVAGHKREDFASFTGGEFGPYLKVGLGYSW